MFECGWLPPAGDKPCAAIDVKGSPLPYTATDAVANRLPDGPEAALAAAAVACSEWLCDGTWADVSVTC